MKRNSKKNNRSTVIIAIIVMLSSMFISCGEDSGVEGEYDNNSVLTESQKYALSYMWHEEKLAYDIYTSLNDIYPIRQMKNITKSETKHMESVREIVESYNLDITNLSDSESGYSEEVLESMSIGEYKLDKIQALYDLLYSKGKNSEKDALEVACMVEVTDIDDLANFLEDETLPQDIKSSFTFLIEGSYKHYWAFDRALKSIDVENGCSSLGTIDGVDYCHPEYPGGE